MKIDRARFLILTSVIAAGVAGAVAGCSSSADKGTSSADVDASSDASTTTDSSSTEDGSTDDASDAAACLAANGDAGPDAGDPLSDCASLTGLCGPACESMALRVTQVVGNEVFACMKAKQNQAACQSTFTGYTLVGDCSDPILDQLCPDPTAASFCAPLVATCNGVDAGAPDAGLKHAFTQANCEKYVAALTARGRTSLTTCVNAALDRPECEDCFVGWQ